MRRSRIKNRLAIVTLIFGMTVAYNEYIAYEIESLHWAYRNCPDCTKILLVADPQILGIKNENYPGSSLAIWDSDRPILLLSDKPNRCALASHSPCTKRMKYHPVDVDLKKIINRHLMIYGTEGNNYLRKTFSRALRHSQPHVIAFLGDLMDEGHIAPAEHFEKYKRRLDYIFQTPDHVMKIYLPGDNDIGGEEDSVSSHISDRFEFTYSQPDTLTYKSLNFFKVNRLTHAVPGAPNDAFLNDYAERNTTNIVLSHMPLLFSPGSFVQSVVKKLSPQLIFTAHDHKAMHTSLDIATDELSDIEILPPHENRLYQLRLDIGDIHEIQIPTCSYRMGTPHIGYGVAYVDTQEKTVEFTILWQPNRFMQLLVYHVVGVILIIFSIFFVIGCACRVTSSHTAYTRFPNM